MKPTKPFGRKTTTTAATVNGAAFNTVREWVGNRAPLTAEQLAHAAEIAKR